MCTLYYAQLGPYAQEILRKIALPEQTDSNVCIHSFPLVADSSANPFYPRIPSFPFLL